jgi:hypothetical protein
VGCFGGPLSGSWAGTLPARTHFQQWNDADADGWSDLPSYSRGVFRPRVFWNDDAGNRFFAMVGVTV